MTTSYNLKRLVVDLTAGTITEEAIDQEQAKKYLGGRGLAEKWLYDEGVAKVDALSPENDLIFINGPLTGTTSPTAGRYMVVTKQPLNDMIGCANSGGVWGAKLKYAGWDAVVFKGKSEKPVRLVINDGDYELVDASEIWGKGLTSTEIDEYLVAKHGEKSASLYIGVAGENLSLMACVMNDIDRAAGRGGVGAVMGSKNLKAITVNASRGLIAPNDKDAMQAAFKEAMRKIKENDVTHTGLPTYGTAVLVNIINSIGALPTKNWQESYFEQAEDISGEALTEKYLTRNQHCHRCPIGCGRVVKFGSKDNPDVKEVAGPEYETLWAFGSNLDNNNLDLIDHANFWCNEMGLDSISVPTTIAAAMELRQRGYIKDEDLEGLPPLDWGEAEGLHEWVQEIAHADRPLASLMAQGSVRLCEAYGAPKYSMSAKKLEMPAYDARAVQGIGLEYATSNRGGCHVRGYSISSEVLGLPFQTDRTAVEGKGALIKLFQDLTTCIDSVGLCIFSVFAMDASDYTALYNAATGSSLTQEEFLEAGERIYNLERLFNKEAGQEPYADTLPDRLLHEPITNGPSKGMVSRLPEMLPDYYEARGWNEEGFPTEETIARLGLND